MLSKAIIKDIQSLQQKKFRDESHSFLAEGPKVVKELILSGIFQCKSIYAVSKWSDSLEKGFLNNIEDRLTIIEDFELEKIATYSTPNNVVAVFEKNIPDENFAVKNNITLVLDGIQDPGNLGTIIRTADWFGIKNIVCSKNTADKYNPKVVQSTMASLANVNIVYTDLGKWLTQHQSVKKIAATLGGADLKSYTSIKESIIIIGNEANGITPEILQLADEKVTIPRIGMAESLNAAVATAIILYAIKGS
jgi:TrmH family RNA methyltransferase